MSSSEFNVSIELGNDTMQTTEHVADALDRIAKVLRTGGSVQKGRVRDLNGNHVGSWSYNVEEEP
jgi:hypothetical protein